MGLGVLIIQNPNPRWTTFVGLGVLVIAAPVTGIFVGIMTQQREDMLAYTDKRIVLVNQLLAGIKALKTYAWEAAQEARVRGPCRGICACISDFGCRACVHWCVTAR